MIIQNCNIEIEMMTILYKNSNKMSLRSRTPGWENAMIPSSLLPSGPSAHLDDPSPLLQDERLWKSHDPSLSLQLLAYLRGSRVERSGSLLAFLDTPSSTPILRRDRGFRFPFESHDHDPPGP